MERKYKVEFITEIECSSVADGLQKIKETYKMFKADVKPFIPTRSDNQNSALHLWLTQLEAEMKTNGITMDMVITKPQEIPVTRHLLKDLFRLIGKKMFHRDSTAKLLKDEFSSVQETFEKVIGERTEIYLPFPSEERMMDEDLTK